MGCLHSTAWTCGLIKCLTNPAKIQTLYNSTNISCWSFADNLYVRCCEYFSEQKKPFAWFYFSASSLTFMLKEAVPIQDFSSLGLLISWFSSFKFQRHRRGMEIAQVCSLAGFVKVTNALWCCFPTWLHKLGFGFFKRKMMRISVDYFWSEALILNRTVPLFLPSDSACYKVPIRLPGEGLSVVHMGSAASDRMAEGSCPSKFSIQV